MASTAQPPKQSSSPDELAGLLLDAVESSDSLDTFQKQTQHPLFKDLLYRPKGARDAFRQVIETWSPNPASWQDWGTLAKEAGSAALDTVKMLASVGSPESAFDVGRAQGTPAERAIGAVQERIAPSETERGRLITRHPIGGPVGLMAAAIGTPGAEDIPRVGGKIAKGVLRAHVSKIGRLDDPNIINALMKVDVHNPKTNKLEQLDMTVAIDPKGEGGPTIMVDWLGKGSEEAGVMSIDPSTGKGPASMALGRKGIRQLADQLVANFPQLRSGDWTLQANRVGGSFAIGRGGMTRAGESVREYKVKDLVSKELAREFLPKADPVAKHERWIGQHEGRFFRSGMISNDPADFGKVPYGDVSPAGETAPTLRGKRLADHPPTEQLDRVRTRFKGEITKEDWDRVIKEASDSVLGEGKRTGRITINDLDSMPEEQVSTFFDEVKSGLTDTLGRKPEVKEGLDKFFDEVRSTLFPAEVPATYGTAGRQGSVRDTAGRWSVGEMGPEDTPDSLMRRAEEEAYRTGGMKPLGGRRITQTEYTAEELSGYEQSKLEQTLRTRLSAPQAAQGAEHRMRAEATEAERRAFEDQARRARTSADIEFISPSEKEAWALNVSAAARKRSVAPLQQKAVEAARAQKVRLKVRDRIAYELDIPASKVPDTLVQRYLPMDAGRSSEKLLEQARERGVSNQDLTTEDTNDLMRLIGLEPQQMDEPGIVQRLFEEEEGSFRLERNRREGKAAAKRALTEKQDIEDQLWERWTTEDSTDAAKMQQQYDDAIASGRVDPWGDLQ